MRLTLLLLAWLTLPLSACAQTTPAARGDGPALWRIADADSEIWLFGTVHILPPDLQWRTQRINDAFASADTLVLETDTSGANAERLRALFLERGMDRSGETLSSRLSAAENARLERVARELGLNVAAMQPMRPWFAAMQLSLLFVQAQGQEPEAGVEAVLGREGARRNMRHVYFETPEEQIGFLADLPPEIELAFLTSTLRQIEEEDANIEEMDEAWVNGDTERLSSLLNDAVDEAGPEVRAALLTDRNARWVREIRAMLAGRGRIFIAVGAAHLVGEDSVVDLLREQGVTVEGP